jgi:16S rRNA processing protein RimM
MKYPDFYYLGMITKSFGIKGQLFVYLDTDEPEKYQDLDAVFVDLGNEVIPYPIENFQYRNNHQAVVKFSDVDAEEAKSLIKCDLYLPLSMLPPLKGNRFYFHEVIGFTVKDQQKGEIGICKDFLDIGAQSIMQIDKQGTEILLPVVDEYLKEVDREKHIIHVEAPEGLIDIYLSNTQNDEKDIDG